MWEASLAEGMVSAKLESIPTAAREPVQLEPVRAGWGGGRVGGGSGPRLGWITGRHVGPWEPGVCEAER